jgi:hypothetical protein
LFYVLIGSLRRLPKRHTFLHTIMENKKNKNVKTRWSYDAEFKKEVTRMLASSRSAREVSVAFGIATVPSLPLEKHCNKT